MASIDSNSSDRMSTPSLERYLSVTEVSRATGIPRRTIYDAIARGELAVFVPHGCRKGYRVAESEVARWIGSRVTAIDGQGRQRDMVPVAAGGRP